MSHSGKLPKLHTPKVPVHMLPVTCLSGKMHGDTLLQGCSLALSLSLWVDVIAFGAWPLCGTEKVSVSAAPSSKAHLTLQIFSQGI